MSLESSIILKILGCLGMSGLFLVVLRFDLRIGLAAIGLIDWNEF